MHNNVKHTHCHVKFRSNVVFDNPIPTNSHKRKPRMTTVCSDGPVVWFVWLMTAPSFSRNQTHRAANITRSIPLARADIEPRDLA